MAENKQNISLYNFLGKPAGGAIGKAVYEAAKKAGEKVSSEEIKTKRYEGKVITYRREFLEEYFKQNPLSTESKINNNDLPF